MTYSVGVVGATGYTGVELCRLLAGHPEFSLDYVTSNQFSGELLSDHYPQLQLDLTLQAFDPKKLPKLDGLFLAVPHATTNAFMADLMELDMKIVDLSADFRLNDVNTFESYYKVKHESPELLEKAVLGFPEIFGDELKAAKLCANPGCFSTAAILGAYPVAKEGLISPRIVVDGKTGVTGAGKSVKASNLYCEVNETFSAYNTGVHRHEAEMVEVLGVSTLFSPHLLPMNRGILTTIYTQLELDVTEETITDIYNRYYSEQPFITVDPTLKPSTKWVNGSNRCVISFKKLGDQLVIFSMIDNLMKGASGQAIQNMNLMFGLDQTLGLTQIPHYL